MIEIIPIMLFLIEWNPERPGALDLQRQPGLHGSVEACEAVGKRIIARKNEKGGGFGGARYKFSCQKMPTNMEFQNLFERAK